MKSQGNESKLNPFELEAMLKWVDSFELTRCRRKLSRDFADAVLLAEILKFEFPSLVELHNYAGCSAVSRKMQNWNTLNRKVLKKLQIHLEPEEIEQVVKAETNCIEEILFRVMKQLETIKSRCKSKSSTSIYEESSGVMTVKVWKQIGDHVEQVPQKMIQLTMYEELGQKCERQQEMIVAMQEKIDDMQDAMTWKTQMIEDLKDRLEKELNKKKQTMSISSIKESLTNLF